MHISRTFIRFCIVGVANTGVDAGLFWLLSSLDWNIFTANLASTTAGLLCSFVLNSTYTFRLRTFSVHQIACFVIYTGLGLWLLQPAIIWLVHTALAIPLIISKCIAIATVLSWNYYWYRHRVFIANET